MNSTTINEYILKLEKLNEESRAKIDQLKKLICHRRSEPVNEFFLESGFVS